MPVHEVFIDFEADTSELDAAIEKLVKVGAVDGQLAEKFKTVNTEIKKQGDAFDKAANSGNNNLKTFKSLSNLLSEFPRTGLHRFLLQVGNDLAEAGGEASNFFKVLKGVGSSEDEIKKLKKEVEDLKNKMKGLGGEAAPKIQSLKQELRQLSEEIARAKAAGSPIDPETIKRAGELKDAIADANAEIKNAGSDTRNIDNVVGSISALAGAFSAVQGAAGLFTDNTEELQKVLLKVNSAMALATGIQQVANAVQKEGSLTKLADVIATKTQIAVQQIYTAVTGRATAATVAFKVALAATGIGLFLVAMLALNEALKETKTDLDAANESIDAQNKLLESQNDLIKRNLEIDLARADQQGKAESELTRIRGKALQAQFENLQAFNKIMAAQRDAVDATSEAWFALNEQIEKNNTTMRDLGKDIIVAGINLEKQLADERKAADEKRKEAEEKRLQKAKEDAEKALRLAREARAAEFNDFKAGVELKILAAEKGSDEELALRKRLLQAELLIDLENEKLTINQRKLLIQRFFADRLQLEKDFTKARDELTLSNIASDLNAELQQINLSNERKLELTESAIAIQAALEVEAANGNAAKITEINAKRDRAILEARKNAIIEAAAFEESFSRATGGSAQRALQKVADDENQKLEVRINAINQLEDIEEQSIDKRIATNQRLFDEGLISENEFVLTEAQLLDERNQVWENAEEKRGDLVEKTNEQIKASMIQASEAVIATLSEVTQTLDTIFSNQAAAENDKLNEQKAKLKELQDAGTITEKEAIQRQRRIDAEERKIKQQQAERDKKVEVFRALLAIPSAILQGLKAGGPILAAIYGALAAVQAAAVISRPVPKFAKGKKDRYEGPGIVGERGAELIQRADGKMYVTTKPTLIYVGSKDKIFTHTETKSMLPHVDKAAMRPVQKPEMDYDKLAQAILKNLKPQPGTNINIDKEFISESVHNGLLKTNYFDRYYKST